MYWRRLALPLLRSQERYPHFSFFVGAQLRSSYRCPSPRKRLFSSKGNNEDQENLRMHTGFTTFRRFTSFARFIIEKSKEENGYGFLRLIEDFEAKHIVPPCSHLIPQVLSGFNMKVYNEFGGALMIISDLQHPLLSKYHFDPVEFMQGARDIFPRIVDAQWSPALYDYCKGNKDAAKEDRFFLQKTHAEMLYENWLRVISKFDEAPEWLEITLDNAYLHQVEVHIADEKQSQYAGLKKEIRSKFPRYPSGSVIVYAHVCYDVFTGQEKDSEKIFYTYQGCISGHKELEWIIVARRSVMNRK